ncbi:hypothetical protein BKI52_27965 [marine bacterium AO1-C]|nr:hypothetical protein BKI52_27965 [marine bacterium AO1-C]
MNKTLKIAKWVLAVLLAFLFISSGYPKLFPKASMIHRFAAWGYAPWFMKAVGLVELLGGVLLAVPKTAFYAALVLAIVMLGAVYTHIATGIGGPGFAFIILILLLGVAFLWFKTIQAITKSNIS